MKFFAQKDPFYSDKIHFKNCRKNIYHVANVDSATVSVHRDCLVITFLFTSYQSNCDSVFLIPLVECVLKLYSQSHFIRACDKYTSTMRSKHFVCCLFLMIVAEFLTNSADVYFFVPFNFHLIVMPAPWWPPTICPPRFQMDRNECCPKNRRKRYILQCS